MVASTGIYGDIAERVGGDAVEVTVLLDDASVDPHEFQGTARDVLALSRADVVVVNGGGYDGFMDELLDGADNPSAQVIDMAAAAGVPDGGNEHVFYDPENIDGLVDDLAASFSAARPDAADRFVAAAAELHDELAGIAAQVRRIDEHHRGTPVAVTDPAAEAFVTAAGLDDRTPEAFLVAVEDGTGVAPRTARQVLDLIADQAVDLVVTEAGAVDAQIDEVLRAADATDLPVVTVTEMLPPGEHYVAWMRDNFERLDRALDGAS